MKSSLKVAALVALATGASYAQSPSLAALNPNTAAAGGSDFTLNVTGSNFQNGAFVSWNSVALLTAFASSTQLSAIVPANLTNAPGFIPVTVVNPGGVRSNGLSFTVTAVPLSISTADLPAGIVGTAYSHTLAAAGGVAPHTWTPVTTVPPGLTLLANGAIIGTPAGSGVFNFTVRVTDLQPLSATKAFSLTIAPPPLSISTTSPLPSGTVGQPYTLSLVAAGGVPPYNWAIGQGLPPGVTLDRVTGTLTGAPTDTGTYNFPLQVTDAAQGAINRNFALTINPPPLSIATLPPLFNATVGNFHVQTFSAAGGVPPYRWTLISGSTGDLRLDPAGTLQGTPQGAGTLSFTIQVSDNVGTSVRKSFTITVNTPILTITTAATLQGGSVGQSYSQKFSVVGGMPPYTWSLTGGSVPGLRFDANQVALSGTPDTPGAFTLTLQVRDSNGLSATRSFTLEIAPAPLTIATAGQLPGATLGAAYSYRMTASGGVPPYTWSANGLPDGLTLDAATGSIYGTLNAAGSLSFTIRVTDSNRSTEVNLFRMTVGLPALPSVQMTGLPATAGPAEQFTLQVAVSAAYPVAISGQAVLTFSPDSGPGDGTIQFSSGGSTAAFTIPAGSTNAAFPAPLALQTGTVAGTIGISLRLQAGGLDVTPSAASITTRIDRAAPVIHSARVIRNANGFSIEIAGFSTAREVTQATYTFTAASGQTLQIGQIPIPLDPLFGNWYQDPANARYGSQFVLIQPFTIQGDAAAVIPQSVTLTNRLGAVTSDLTQ